MPLFRKKPVVIEAEHWDDGIIEASRIAEWVNTNGGTAFTIGPDNNLGIEIDTLEGTMTASPGDWVLKGVQGEFYPCKPDIFAATYEEVR